MRSVLILFVFIIGCTNHADDLSEEFNALGFIEKPVPKVGSKLWSSASASFPANYVESGNPLVVRKATRAEEDPSDVIFEAGPIEYIGVDHGEFGGGLYVNEVSDSSEPLLNANVRALIPIKNDLYIISGLAHLHTSRGAIHVIRNYNEPSEPKQITLLPDAPEAVAIEELEKGNKTIVIAGYNSLMTFTPDSGFEIIKFNAFWAGLYPSSIVKYKHSYVIGMRSGLAVVTPDPYMRASLADAKVQYFVPH